MPLFQGTAAAQACKQIGVVEQAYHRWLWEYGGMNAPRQIVKKYLEKENAKLHKAVADLTLEKLILADLASISTGRSPWMDPEGGMGSTG